MRRKLKRKIEARLCLTILAMLFCLTGYAQSKRIAGKTTSADDSQPLPGVSIKVKGTATGTVSGVDGSYAIMAKPGDVLVFSFLGYTSQQVTVEQDNTINVKLKPTATNLNEVVAIGYANTSRKYLTGAISSISAKDIASTVSTTFDQALQGKMAGVTVTQNSGQPGGGVTIQVRGIGSINAGTDPLYVIDGVIIPPGSPSSTGGVYMGNSGTRDNPLSTINPNDIASIDVLKDASAIAIYA